MDDYKRMAVFAAVVQHGSMSAAARTLGMSPSAVSQQVRQLERDGGVTLLHRSTRQLGPVHTNTGSRKPDRAVNARHATPCVCPPAQEA